MERTPVSCSAATAATEDQHVKCPVCPSEDTRVIDSRPANEGQGIRRRRECERCLRRFTTYERIAESWPQIIKRDGRREPYDRSKISEGLRRAFTKRPTSVETLDRLIDQFEREMQEWGDREVSSDTIGRWFIDKLRSTDEVAYVRFASVFRSFNDLEEFLAELEGLRMERQQRVSRGSW